MTSINKEFEDFVLAEMGDVAVVNGDRYDSPKIQAYYKVWCASREQAPEFYAAKIEEVKKENRALRRVWCARSGTQPYMDDGEAQDSSSIPFIDFLREPVVSIQDKLLKRVVEKLKDEKCSMQYLLSTSWAKSIDDANRQLNLETFCAYLLGGKTSDEAVALMVTTAYESGVGKGHQVVLENREVTNPWVEGACHLAWDLGLEEGKDQARRTQLAAREKLLAYPTHVVNGGALTLALNALDRAGKTEIANAVRAATKPVAPTSLKGAVPATYEEYL